MTAVRLPAEWEPQEGILLSWPTASTDWSANLAAAEATYLALVKAISRFETAHICCQDAAIQQRVTRLISEQGISAVNIALHILPYDDTWTRDYGPVTVSRNGKPSWLDFRFNAWGGKYPHTQDDRVTRLLHGMPAFEQRQCTEVDFVLEGGSIDSDGRGGLLTTTRCLLSPQRNPGYDKAEIEQRLFDLLGTQRVLWLQQGELEGDDTDAHIDTLARFCNAETIAYTRCQDPLDSHARSLDNMKKELQALRQSNGQPYHLVPLPLPTACFNRTSERLPATYANFLILNGAVLVPTYDVATDRDAMTQLQQAFPDREVIGVPCRPLLEQYGSLHCVTMHLPACAL